MPKQTIAFEIDDNLTADQTLAAFAEAMKQADASLAEVLAPLLSDLSLDVAIDQDQLLDALYAATAPADAGAPKAHQGEGQ
jgi:hypothetical protein